MLSNMLLCFALQAVLLLALLGRHRVARIRTLLKRSAKSANRFFALAVNRLPNKVASRAEQPVKQPDDRPRLFFTEVVPGPNNIWVEHTSMMLRRINRALKAHNWSPLKWNQRFFESNNGYTFCRKLWCDPCHPKPAMAIDQLVDFITAAGIPKGSSIAVFGDSTLASAWTNDYSGSTYKGKIAYSVEARTGVKVWLCSVCGTRFGGRNGFINTARNELKNNPEWRYDAILLVGGWNQWHVSYREAMELVRDFTQAAKELLL